MTFILPAFWSLILSFASPSIATAAVPTTAPIQPPASERLATGFEPGHADFALSFGDHEVPFGVMGVFALPGEQIPIVVSGDEGRYQVEATEGHVENLGSNRWSWEAPPSAGASVLRVRRLDDGATVTLNAFILVPYDQMRNGRVNGYRIGSYPAPRSRHAEREARPAGFIELTAETADMLVSPHFQLSQFACKEGTGYPKYLVVQTPLLMRLEHLLETLNREGIAANTFQVMSAYRTPLYNRNIGNETTFTRHQYGDAADIIVDEAPADGRMDDLNGNHRHDRGDAMVLHRIAEETEGDPAGGGLDGGLSAYAANHSHGPFVHVDTRGYQARW